MIGCINLATGDRSDLQTFRVKADAVAAIDRTRLPLVPLPAHTLNFRCWLAGITVSVDDAIVRVLVLTENDTLVPVTYETPDGFAHKPVDQTGLLSRLVGDLVTLIMNDGGHDRVVILEVDSSYAILRRANGRIVARHIATVAAVVPLHMTSTNQVASIDRTWRVKPSGRALGWRPIREGGVAHCSCGWSAVGASRQEARLRARHHRRDAAVRFPAAGT